MKIQDGWHIDVMHIPTAEATVVQLSKGDEWFKMYLTEDEVIELAKKLVDNSEKYGKRKG